MFPRLKTNHGFTIVELLIVIVVIGVLAAITIIAYAGIQDRARMTKITADLTTLSRAVQAARLVSQKTMNGITLSYWTAGSCAGKAAGTNLGALPTTDACWTSYTSVLDRISTAGGINVRNMVDPWGRPYFIDENEGEAGNCGTDVIAAYAQPFNASATFPGAQILVPLSGFSGCAI